MPDPAFDQRWQHIRALRSANRVGYRLLLLTSGFALAFVLVGLPDLSTLLSQALGVAVTVLLLDHRNQRRSDEQVNAILRAQWVAQAGSDDNAVARAAVGHLRNRGWLRGATGALRNAGLSGANLGGVSLQGANLEGARLSRAQLASADLSFARLQAAHLGSADLRGAKLLNAHMDGAKLGATDLRGADLTGATLTGAALPEAKLDRANLETANLSSADLSEATVAAARLPYAKLMSANLSYAAFNDAHLWHAHLEGAQLRHAHWHGCDLYGANLAGAKGIETVHCDEMTVLPDATPLLYGDTGYLRTDASGRVRYTPQSYWSPTTDMTRYTDPAHPNFWQPAWAALGYAGALAMPTSTPQPWRDAGFADDYMAWVRAGKPIS